MFLSLHVEECEPAALWVLLPIALAIPGRSRVELFQLGFATAMGWLTAGLGPLAPAALQFGSVANVIIGAALFASLMSALLGIGFCAVWSANSHRTVGAVAFVALLWEGFVPSPCPFPLGGALVATPLSSICPYFGERGLTALGFALSVACADLVRRRRARPAVLLSAIAGFLAISAVLARPAPPPGETTIALFTGAIDAKTPSGPAEINSALRALPSSPSWIVFPESMWSDPVPESELPALAADLIDRTNAGIILGATTTARSSSVVLLRSPGESSFSIVARKLHPLPWSERTGPFDLRNTARKIAHVESSPASLVCSDVLFEGDVANLVGDPASPSALLVIANDGWFDRPEVARAHRNVARLRAATFQISVGHVDRAGGSAWFDAGGQPALAETPSALFRERALPTRGEPTFFGRYGAGPLWGLVAGAFLWGRGRDRRPD